MTEELFTHIGCWAAVNVAAIAGAAAEETTEGSGDDGENAITASGLRAGGADWAATALVVGGWGGQTSGGQSEGNNGGSELHFDFGCCGLFLKEPLRMIELGV